MAKSNIMIVGLLKNPKQEFAKLLADKLEMCFVDTDAIFDVEHNSLKEVLDNFGSKYYNEIESKTIDSISGFDNSVIVSNLPTLFSADNLIKIKQNVLIIYIQINSKVFKKLNSFESGELGKAKLIMNEIVFAERDKNFCENADIIIDASSLKMKKILKNAVKSIKKYYKKR